jgi:hypothetical protein
MNNQNVIALPASTSYTPEQALQSASQLIVHLARNIEAKLKEKNT